MNFYWKNNEYGVAQMSKATPEQQAEEMKPWFDRKESARSPGYWTIAS